LIHIKIMEGYVNNIHMKEIREIIERVIKLSVRMDEIGADDDLLMLGMDSINCIKLLAEIEKVLNIAFDDEDLDLEKWNTINKLTAIIGKYCIVLTDT
jgi:acyl carrier protein